MPDAETTRRLVEALAVRRNATIGFGVALALAVLAYAYRVFELGGTVEATRGSPVLFVLLAFVLTVSAGALFTTVLVLRRAVHLAREGGSPPSDPEADSASIEGEKDTE